MPVEADDAVPPADAPELGTPDRRGVGRRLTSGAVPTPRARSRASAIRELLTEYFGERPALSLEKVTLRLTTPTAQSAWHQDASLHGLVTAIREHLDRTDRLRWRR